MFVGGGTPTFTEPEPLRRLLAALPAAAEVTVEANPETVTAELAALLRDGGVTASRSAPRHSLRGCSQVLERGAGPDDVRRAMHTLRDASFDNISLDLIYGIPGQEPSDLDHDLAEALALAPEHLSLYELEAKPGTRFTHAFGDELARQSEAMEGYFERVVETLTAAGYRWYETANFCLDGLAGRRPGPPRTPQPRLLARARLPRRRDRGGVDPRRPASPQRGLHRRYIAALERVRSPPRELEPLDPRRKRRSG